MQSPTSDIEHPTSNTVPNRGHLLTEQRLGASHDLDALSVSETLQLINDQDAAIAGVVRDAIPQITPLVEAIVSGMRRGGRLIYLGAGTSGRLGVLDASECPPTFHSDPGQVVGVIAGGDGALRKSSEGKEDEPEGASDELTRIEVGPDDVVVGIAAGGTTPYVLGGLDIARSRGAVTALITCAEPASRDVSSRSVTESEGAVSETDDPAATRRGSRVDHIIHLPVGPEVLTGSTRMKAGTATKLALNMISTTVMTQLGKAWGNLMVDLRATNAKLRDRAARILVDQCGLTREDALEQLDAAEGRVKRALVMAKRHVNADEAERLLAEHNQQLRPIIGAPAPTT